METDIKDSKFPIIGVKTELIERPTLFPKAEPCYGYSHVEIDCKKAEWAVSIKEEKCEGALVQTTALTIDAHISSNEIVLNDTEVNVKDDDDALNFINNEPCKQGNASSKSEAAIDVMTYNKFHEDNIQDIYAKKYKCKICSRHFKTRNVILKHVKLHAEEKIQEFQEVNNGDVDKLFTTEQILWNHVDVHIDGGMKCDTGERTYKCEICTKPFTSKRSMLRHVKAHTDEKNYKCEICDKCFATNPNMLRHMKSHTGERNHQCEICNKRFARKYTMLVHVERHADEQNYKCEICNKCFITKINLAAHVKWHTRERSYECKICGKRFTSKQHLAVHAKIHSDDRERNYECGSCGKRFTTKQGMLRHMKMHTGERNYKCEICNKLFIAKQHLLHHMQTHTGGRCYECEICGKCFTTNQSMLRHMKGHTDERYNCEVCSKRFTLRQNMLRHMKVHGGEAKYRLKNINEKNYKCKLCNKRTSTKRCLLQHTRTHTVVTNHKCEICTEHFKKRKALLEHMKIHDEKINDGMLQYFPCFVSTITTKEIKADTPFIKEETGVALNNDNDDAGGKPSTAVNENRIGPGIKEEALHNEIIIKEEHIMDSSLFMETHL